ncbi:M20 family peptidase [Clostridium oceanicum]|uniref:Peptidase M20 domain-containing protein 2 n=1 Tax=Clostridium oceanicum TaxID=1543 RepID=A0ABN1JPA1_9CLOT
MKQRIVSYLDTIKNELFNISKYLYENPEESFKEFKACDYLSNLLEKHDFKVKKNYLDIPTSFCGTYGSGYPKICFFCEYDTPNKENHISGHNLISEMSIGAALSLSKVIDNFSGTIIVIGCPGEFLSGSKVTLAKQGAFKDIDVGLMAHPDVITCESDKSMAIIPMKMTFKGENTISYENPNIFSSLNGFLYTFNSINLLKKCYKDEFHIDKLNIKSGENPYNLSNTTKVSFYIRAKNINLATKIENKIRKIVKHTEEILDLDCNICFYELPYRELITNKTLSRIFSHNLKESGIIDLCGSKNTVSGLSLGTVSHYIPCIHPYISIVDKTNNIDYFSKEFASNTLSNYAQNRTLKATQALALTALDLIENRELLNDVKNEFFNKIKTRD